MREFFVPDGTHLGVKLVPNATILLCKLECTRFNKMKQEAWGNNSILTPRGKEEYDATFTNLNLNHFLFHVRDEDEYWQVRVLRQNVAGQQEQVILDDALVERTRLMRCHVNTSPQLHCLQ